MPPGDSVVRVTNTPRGAHAVTGHARTLGAMSETPDEAVSRRQVRAGETVAPEFLSMSFHCVHCHLDDAAMGQNSHPDQQVGGHDPAP
jgi:hypothetical protein